MIKPLVHYRDGKARSLSPSPICLDDHTKWFTPSAEEQWTTELAGTTCPACKVAMVKTIAGGDLELWRKILSLGRCVFEDFEMKARMERENKR